MAAAVVITGMHRSGTSLLASFLERAGLDLGTDFFPADPRNPRGYFEDRELLELQTAMLHSCCAAGEVGWLDWGWTESERLDRSGLPAFHCRAAALVAAHAVAGRVWGFKDPRASLLLDLWDALLAEPCYVFVYRSPWEVMRSVARLPVPLFAARPDIGLRTWAFYNRHLLAFRRAHRERSLLLPIEALLADPDAVLESVRTKLGIALPERGRGRVALGAVVDPDLLTPLGGSPALLALLARLFPDAAKLWLDLEEEADLRAGRPAQAACDPGAPPDGASTVLSVILYAEDDGELLPEAVAAVQSVPEPACEVLVVDGGSTDPYTREVLARLPAAGVPVLHSGTGGLAAARNAGIRAVRGPCVLAMGAHRLRPEFVARALDVFDRERGVGAVYGDAPRYPDRPEDGRIADLDAAPIDACLALRREVWEQCGGYDEMLAGGYEDWDLLLSAAERGWQLRHVPEAVCELRTRPGAPRRTAPPAADHRLFLERLAAEHPLLVDHRLPRLWREREALWLAELERSRHLEQAVSARGAELAALGRELELAGGELADARRELEGWRRRVEFMEGTRAWRSRGALLRLRRWLAGERG
jgi:hypothetical protein